jgi:hypothetical protein
MLVQNVAFNAYEAYASSTGLPMSTAEPLRKEGEEHLPPSLVALKRAAEARGIHVQLPPPGARWVEHDPIVLPEGVSLSELVIRLRGNDV